MKIDWEGTPGNFRDDGNILYLDYSGNHVYASVCQKSWTCTLKTGTFYCR